VVHAAPPEQFPDTSPPRQRVVIYGGTTPTIPSHHGMPTRQLAREVGPTPETAI